MVKPVLLLPSSETWGSLRQLNKNSGWNRRRHSSPDVGELGLEPISGGTIGDTPGAEFIEDFNCAERRSRVDQAPCPPTGSARRLRPLQEPSTNWIGMITKRWWLLVDHPPIIDQVAHVASVQLTATMPRPRLRMSFEVGAYLRRAAPRPRVIIEVSRLALRSSPHLSILRPKLA